MSWEQTTKTRPPDDMGTETRPSGGRGRVHTSRSIVTSAGPVSIPSDDMEEMRSPRLGAATVLSEVSAHQSTIPKPGAPKAGYFTLFAPRRGQCPPPPWLRQGGAFPNQGGAYLIFLSELCFLHILKYLLYSVIFIWPIKAIIPHGGFQSR